MNDGLAAEGNFSASRKSFTAACSSPPQTIPSPPDTSRTSTLSSQAAEVAASTSSSETPAPETHTKGRHRFSRTLSEAKEQTPQSSQPSDHRHQPPCHSDARAKRDRRNLLLADRVGYHEPIHLSVRHLLIRVFGLPRSHAVTFIIRRLRAAEPCSARPGQRPGPTQAKASGFAESRELTALACNLNHIRPSAV
jgi:hypothetical protein